MKCQERFTIIQTTMEHGIYNEDGIYTGKVNGLYETQLFAECYKEDCAAWDSENHCCGKVGNR